MVWLVLGMTIAVVLAAFVVGVVAIPARRSGRFVLTERGEKAFRVADERARAARSRVARREGDARGNAETKTPASEQPVTRKEPVAKEEASKEPVVTKETTPRAAEPVPDKKAGSNKRIRIKRKGK